MTFSTIVDLLIATREQAKDERRAAAIEACGDMATLKARVGETYLAYQAAVAEYEAAVERLEAYEEKETSWRLASMRR